MCLLGPPWFGCRFGPGSVEAGESPIPARCCNQRGGFVFAHPLPPAGHPAGRESISALALRSGNAVVRRPERQSRRAASPKREVFFLRAGAGNQSRGKKGADQRRNFGEMRHTHLRRTSGASNCAKYMIWPAPKRGRAIGELFEASLDTKALNSRWQAFQQQRARLRGVTNVLFVYLFVAIPLLSRPGWAESLLALSC